jgi:hypothetical protein
MYTAMNLCGASGIVVKTRKYTDAVKPPHTSKHTQTLREFGEGH